ncbi:MAG: helix-turn-helix transcriptional regulator [Succinivibrio sp.]
MQKIKIVQLAADFIEKHVTEEISIQMMAKCLNVSSGYLSRTFKKHMHITPKQYQIQTRLRLAKKSMEEQNSDIQTAYDTGFSSQSHLCSVFKKYMGICVGDYKNCKE